MSSAIAAYFVAAALMLRFGLGVEDAAKRAADLWKAITERI